MQQQNMEQLLLFHQLSLQMLDFFVPLCQQEKKGSGHDNKVFLWSVWLWNMRKDSVPHIYVMFMFVLQVFSFYYYTDLVWENKGMR